MKRRPDFGSPLLTEDVLRNAPRSSVQPHHVEEINNTVSSMTGVYLMISSRSLHTQFGITHTQILLKAKKN